MSPYAERVIQRLREAEADLLREVDDQQRRWRYRVHRGRVAFDRDVHRAHERLRTSIPAYLSGANVFSLLTAPVIYSLLLPFAVLHVWVWMYELLCFPVYGIARVPHAGYFALDRHRLAYLNGIEKANCTFCTYANGVVAYVREVAARTEQYWCPIKHSRTVRDPHARYQGFFDYGDAEGYRHGAAPSQAGRRTDRPCATSPRPR